MAAAPQSPAFSLSEGGPSDLADVMKVMTSAFPSRFGEGWSRSQCAGILPLNGVRLMIARSSNEDVAGFSLERRVLDEAELLLLAVDERYQGQGVGSQLMVSFIERNGAVPVAQLHLEVREGNRAVAMYENFGFRRAGQRKDYYRGADGRKYDAVTMIRTVK